MLASLHQKRPYLFYQLAFALSLILRFEQPFLQSPFDGLLSDMRTHWNSGLALLHPDTITGALPKLYAVWIFLINQLSFGHSWVVQLMVGLLSVGGALCWYRACREVLPVRFAYGTAIVIALHPSLSLIFRYFMTESLLFAVMGLAFWLTFRARRKKDIPSFAWAVFAWMLALLTKQTVLPMALLSLFYLFVYQPRRLTAAGVMTAILLAGFIPAALHSYKGTGVASPLRSGYSGKVYRLCNTQSYGYGTSRGETLFSSNAMYINPFDPFFSYKTYREPGKCVVPYNPQTKQPDWERGLAGLKAAYTTKRLMQDTMENFIYLFFAPSWPEGQYVPQSPASVFAYHLRWLWPPMFLMLLICGPFVRVKETQAFLLTVTLMMLAGLIFQQQVVMEGRYRKPIEPLVLLSVAVLAHWFGQKKIPKTGETVFTWSRNTVKKAFHAV